MPGWRLITPVRRPVMRWPRPPMRPSFLVSRCSSSPGRSRSWIGCGGSSAFRRFRPSRRRTLVTVEIGMPSWRAIAGELIRWRRSRSIYPLGRQPVRLTGGRRASVMEGRRAARPPTSHPLANCLYADAEIGCNLPARLFGDNDPTDHEESTVRRRPSILVDVHSELPAWLLMADNHQFSKPAPDEQP